MKKKPIYYKSKISGDCFKVVLNDNISEDDMDKTLDVICPKNTDFITREEFENAYDELMVFSITSVDDDNLEIGNLTTKKPHL